MFSFLSSFPAWLPLHGHAVAACADQEIRARSAGPGEGARCQAGTMCDRRGCGAARGGGRFHQGENPTEKKGFESQSGKKGDDRHHQNGCEFDEGFHVNSP
jgi:hypothetical protein